MVFGDGKSMRDRYLLAKMVFAGSVLLCSSGNALADANLVTSSAFTSADAARANTYMDSAGTWNGTNEVTNTSGDTFVFTIDNQAAGLPVDDTAFDLDISIDVGSNFRLPSAPFVVTVNESPAFPLCPVFPAINATQPGGAGTSINLNIPADTDIPPSCSYSFTLGLTADDVPPSVTDGFYNIDFGITYNVDNDDVNTQTTQTQTENIEVRTGEVALLKTAVTAIAADGDTVEFTVSLLGAGDGGIFDVVLTDILSSDLSGLILIPPANPPGAPGPAGNQYTFDYIAAGEVVDVTVRATVSVDPNAVSCPVLLNTADAVDRTGTTSNFFDAVPFDLQNPFIDYTPPDITVPFGVAGIDVTIPVTNTGTGLAKNISISAANLAAYTVLVDNVASPNWSYAGGGVFNYTGTIAAGITQSIVFNVSANSCPPPADQNLDWIPAYQNACGTDFFPPLRFSSIAVNNTPDISVAKTSSAGTLNIGQPGSYTLTMGGTNVANLPLGAPPNQDFVVTDILPFGITNAVINSVPPTTEVLVNGAAYVTGNPIPDGATIIWRGDRADLSPLPSLQIDYIAGAAGVCPVGQTITNTATVDYAACGINNADSAGFILNENPAGGAITNIVVGGDGNFETGASDSNGVSRDELREGEQIPFTVPYSFPAGFTGTWAGTSFNAELRSAVGTGVPLVLTNNRTDVHVLITRISDGALICNLDLNPATDFTGGDGTGPLVITDFGAIAGCPALNPLNMQDHNMILTYSATSPEGNLDGNGDPLDDTNVGGYLENTTLTVAGGPLSCLGNTDFIQAVNINIERAVLDLTASINNGNPVSVCSVVPATLNVTGPALDTAADNILLQFNDANFEFVDAAGNPGNENTDLVYGGSVASLGLAGSRVANDVFMTPALNTSTVAADGTVNFNIRLRDSMVPQTLSAQLDFDSNHTSPDGSATDADRDYNVTVNATPLAVLSGDLQMEFFPPSIILLDSATYNFRIQIENVGTGTAVNAFYRITLPTGMRFDSAIPAQTSPGPFDFSGQTIEFDLGDLAAGGIVDIDINTSIDQTTCFQNPGEEITSQNEWGCGSPIINTVAAPPLVLAPTQLTLRHDPNNSFCELCNEGEVHLSVSNTGGVLLTNVDVIENLQNSGLTYVPNSTSYFVDGVAGAAPLAEPVISGANNELINWNATQIPELANLFSAFSTAANTPQEIEIVYRVRRNAAGGFDEEGLINADRTISATAGFGLFCGPPPQAASSGPFELPIEQPVTGVIKQARNIDANQPVSAYADTVFGGTADDVIWRVNVTNNGPDSRADLEDLLINDTIGGNFDISQICNNEANATAAANGVAPDGVNCIANAGLNATRNIADPFGNPANDEPGAFIDALEGGETFIYFVGTIANTCTNHTNSTDIEYGCQADSPPQGGIAAPATNGGVQPTFSVSDTAELSTAVNPAGMLISQSITGTNATQPLGSKGILTITIRNQSGGTVRNIAFDDLLPAGYALDKTLINATVTPAFAAYPGMIDTITLINDDVANPENNTDPSFTLTSTGGVVPPAPQDHLLRHGDVLTITLGVIKVNNFDIVADPVIRTEVSAGGSDPAIASPLNSALTVTFENTCSTPLLPVPAVNNLSVTVNPEDLDIDINPADPDLIFILSDPTATLSLDVVVTNNGGHDAADFFTLVTTGSGLNITGVPAGCAATSNPPPRPVWIPALPGTATVYRCVSSDPIAPGQSNTFTFAIQKAGAGADLTFRADVVGEITQAGGAALTFPAPDTGVITNVANNYSLDSIRARLIGFNLTKVLQGDCSEDNPPAVNSNVQIGEDCSYRMEAGWFGFATPGFGSIQIQNISVTDTIPAGQGYISDNTTNSSAGITGITTNPAVLNPLTEEASISWLFNPFATDETFSVDLVTRSMNNALNASAAPNVHATARTDTVDASFDVDFGGSIFTFDNTTPGYPPVNLRQANITITEPNLIVTKEVCNESLNGVGPTCSSFLPLVNDGSTNHDYIYRIRITNEAANGGFPRAPAYNVEVVDTLDATNLLTVKVAAPSEFDGDGLDNDGDGVIDEGGEASFVGTPQVITISHTSSTALQRIDPGQTVDLFYRVDVADAVAPGQMLVNSAVASYDTLAGASGNQSLPQPGSGTAGGAREYSDAAQVATIEITNLVAPPDSKGAVVLSHTPLGGPAPFVGPQDVVIGEEIEFQLQVEMPIASLNNFVIRDELPAGLRCIEQQSIDLSALPYSNAGFVPGGPPVSVTCNDTLVEWNFGNQQLTNGPTFNFTANFIGRIENTVNTNDADAIINGGVSTVATLSYTDAGANPVSIVLGPAELRVVEPQIVLNKTFAVANADAQDVLTVTVTATNTGSAPAYNLRVLDDLTGVANLTFLGNVAGTDPPDNVDIVTLGANSPVFSYNAPNAIAATGNPGDSVSFTFDVLVGDPVQPLEELNNIINADWTSLQSNATAINASGNIGADGAADGMRTGDITNPVADPVNDFETTFDTGNAVTVPAVSNTKTDLTPAVVPTIGARKNFQVELVLPEGDTSNLVVTDNLNFGGLSYVLENNAGFDVTYTFQNITSINGVAPAEAAFNVVPVDGASGSVVWNIGNIITDKENDTATNTVNPIIRINYFARINNDLNTDAGDNMQNEATLNYRNGETGGVESVVSSAPATTVLEPLLTATKTFTNVTAGKLPGDLPDGGDTIEYVLTISNDAASSTAFDVNIIDTLPAELQRDVGFVATATIGGVAVAGFNAIPANDPLGPLNWGRGNADDTLDIPAGQNLVLTYRTRVQDIVEPNLAINNSVLIDWTSLDGVSPEERNGAGCPTVTLPNDYCTGPIVATLNVIDANAINKVITADTFVAPVGTVRIGDTVTFQLQVDIQEGRTRNIVLQDVLPVGMTFVDVVSVNGDATAPYDPPGGGAGSNFSYASIAAASLPAGGALGPTTYTLGTVTNDPNGDATTDTFVIEYRARVTENAGILHLASSTLDNTVTLDYIDAAGAAPLPDPRLSATATTTVLQPLIDTLTKVDRRGPPFISGVTVDPSVDVMQFRLESCNAIGGAPAYSLQLTDDLPIEINETTITGPINGPGNPDVTIGGVAAVDGVDYVYTPPVVRGGNMVFVFTTPLNPNACVDIDFDVAFYNDFAVNQVWDNRVDVDEYWSLPLMSGQQYPVVSTPLLPPATFSMNNTAAVQPPVKVLQSPISAEATIGEEIIYRITVPGAPMPGALNNVVITDIMDPSLIFVSATDVSGNGLTINNNTVLPNNVSLQTDLIPSGQQAVIELRARVNNVAAANAGVTFDNTTAYTFSALAGGPSITPGGSVTTANPLKIVEPLVVLNKTVVNLTQPGLAPDAGDVLQYTLTMTASGGGIADNFSDAFDVSIDDSLSLGFAFSGGLTISGAGNTIAAPVIVGDGVTVPQTLSWSLASGNADIDIAEGTLVIMSYEATVLDEALAQQTLSNSAVMQWSSIDGADINERDGSGVPVVNDYRDGPSVTNTITSNNNTVLKTRLSDTFNAGDNIVRIGDIVDYELRLTIQEGTSPANIIVDTLPQGMMFEGVVSINGDTTAPYAAVAPFTHNAILASSIVTAGNPATGPTTVTWSLGDVINVADNVAANDEFVLVYRARVLNLVHPQVNNINIVNTANFDYTTAVGPAVTQTDNETVVILQPNLAVTKTAAPANGDTIIDAGELITYTVDITNSGTAPAYDAVLNDVIPVGLRNGVGTISNVIIELPVGNPVAVLNPVYDAVTGSAVWNFDTGIADAYTIPVGSTMRVVYDVQADAGIGAGLTMINAANVSLYHSFDDEAVPQVGGVTGVREIYGPSNTATVTLTTPGANALLKENPVQLTQTIGDTFIYRITIPDAPMPTALHDVQITDVLSVPPPLLPGSMTFVSVTRVPDALPQTWVPENVGTATSLVIQDLATGNGIDIPANEQIAIDVEVALRDVPVNVAGALFNNTADYSFNQVDDVGPRINNAGSDTTANMTIVEPLDMVLSKTGPATITFGTPATFTIDVENSILTNANASAAFDLTITDVLPSQVDGGMCDTPPNNFTARIFQADGTTPVSPVLTEGVDYIQSFAADPVCTLTITMQTPVASIGPSERLIITYDASLDVNSVDATMLTNVAAATQWFSADTPAGVAVGEIRTYTGVLSDGTPVVADEQDNHIIEVLGPVLVFNKEVLNVTSGALPPPPPDLLQAEAGDRLRYTLTVTNTGRAPIDDFSITDEPDRLTTPPGLFLPGSLSNIVLPVGLPIGPATDFSNPAAGANGAGILDIRSLSLTAAGGGTDSLVIVFEMVVQPVVENGLIISNQAELISPNFTNIPSDEPNFPGAIDPTQTLIGSAPVFSTLKTSADLTGNTSILAAGDTLRYTLRPQNVGAENSINTILRDQIPANTTYVANSTTLNGIAVADPSAGVSPLEAGMLINAPENTTAGFMRAETTGTTNIATVTFDVVVATNVINGTAISNQSFVQGTGLSGVPYPDQPSDDPDTDLFNDPTIDVVGNLPILKIQKTADFAPGGDLLDNGVVDNNDLLRYTFNIANTGSTQATNVLLSDAVPLNSNYNANSVVVNGVALADTVPGTSPLIAGINVSSTPSPAFPQVGVIEPGTTVTVTFDVTVNATVVPLDLITNQATLDSNELPQKRSDADGNDENGDQPTVVVIGNAQRLSITKEVSVVGGGVATAGGQLEYVITVRNIGSQAATDVVISDTLAAQLTLLPGSATMNGLPTGVTVLGSNITADFATLYGDLDGGDVITLRFVATIDAAQIAGTTISNTARVDWNAGTQNSTDGTSIDIGAAPGVATVNGTVWWDPNFNDVLDTGETILPDWSVDIFLRGQLLDTVTTQPDGTYQINGMVPSAVGGNEYELRYRAPGAGATSASLGQTNSLFTDGQQRIADIVVAAGSFNQALDLPIDPNGVVYDSVLRIPVAGVQLTLINQTRSNQPVPASCFDDPNQQSQVTLARGLYKFDLNFSDASRCASGDEYEIQVQPPANGYVGTTSVIIPPVVPVTGAALNVPGCPGTAQDKVPATAQHCENSALSTQAPTSVTPRSPGTDYHLKFLFNNVPSTDQVFNNHIPVDPELDAAIAISKVSGLQNVTRSQLVPYTITLTNSIGAPLQDLDVIDNFPAGFKYVAGSTRINGAELDANGASVEPLINGLQMVWSNLSVNTNDTLTIKMLLVVGAGVGEGEYVNTARVINSLNGEAASGVASATVRVIPDPTFDCTDIIGKVFDDKNVNAYQDEGEEGLPGVQVATAKGLRVTTDAHGRFHITCAVVANEVRGSNFIMKVDDRSLPSGYRLTSENPRVLRATRGKMLKFNFAAALHRVVRLDLANGVFETGTTELRPQWRSRIDMLIIELQKDASILRLSYLGENETEAEVDDRLDAIEDLISARWQELNCCYKLTIEKEVFWRKGNPSDRKAFE